MASWNACEFELRREAEKSRRASDPGDFTAGSGKYYVFTGIQLRNPKGAPETIDSDALENLEEFKAGGKQ